MLRAARFDEQRLSGNPQRISKAESKGSGIPKDSKPETGPTQLQDALEVVMTNEQVYRRVAEAVSEEIAKWTTPITLDEMIRLIADRYHVNAERLSQEF